MMADGFSSGGDVNHTLSRADGVPRSPLDPSEPAVIEKRFTAASIVEKYRTYLHVDVSEDLASVDEVLLCRGRESNLRFFWPPTLAGTGRFYAKLMSNPHYYLGDKWEYGVAIDALPPRQRVLEVGCGKGDFLAKLRDAGHEGIGLEINDEAIRLGTASGCDIRRGTIEEFAAGFDKPFDVVCAFQVLEHVTDPVAFLNASLACLRDGGLAIFAVPNGEGIFSSLDVALDMPPHHMLRWNGAAIQYLTKLYPLVLDDLCLEPLSRFHVGLLADACFNHPAVSGSGWKSLRRRAVGTLASKYWSHHFEECRLAGHSLFAAFRKVADDEGFAASANLPRGPSGPV
jgi:2-polyprenyl-3-methyl-5-hydroxy-6-metoxy-1,4-benzoquinol methylase